MATRWSGKAVGREQSDLAVTVPIRCTARASCCLLPHNTRTPSRVAADHLCWPSVLCCQAHTLLLARVHAIAASPQALRVVARGGGEKKKNLLSLQSTSYTGCTRTSHGARLVSPKLDPSRVPPAMYSCRPPCRACLPALPRFVLKFPKGLSSRRLGHSGPNCSTGSWWLEDHPSRHDSPLKGSARFYRFRGRPSAWCSDGGRTGRRLVSRLSE